MQRLGWWLGKSFGDDGDFRALVGVWQIERAENERLVEREHGDAFDDGLVDDRIVRANLGGFLADAGLLDLAEQLQAAA